MRRDAAILLALLGLAACAPSRADERPDVLFVCLDTVRADHLGCYGYSRRPTTPRLDDLARGSIVFADATATACWTKPSVPSFLTGTWPIEHGVYEGSARLREGETTDVLPERADTLAEDFRGAGYETAAFVHNAQLRRGNGFEQGFGTYDEGNFDAREIRWRARDWLEGRDRDKPFFLYLHFLDAHYPCPVPDEYAEKFAEGADLSLFRGDDWKTVRDDVNDGKRTLDDAEREGLVALYDGALRYIDDELGRLFDALERREGSRELVICVVADHGEEFLEHGRIGHGHGLYENLLRVPWILRAPGQAAARVEEPVSLVDLRATLLAAAGLPAPTVGVERLTRGHGPTPLFAEHKEPGGYQQSLRVDRFKLVRRFSPASVPGVDDAEGEAELPAVGSRWEVEVELGPEGTLRATKLSLRDDPASDPVEVKGTVERRDPASVHVCSVEIRVGPGTEIYGEVPVRDGKRMTWEDGLAAPGSMVKAVGRFEGAGFLADKIKLYGPGERLEHAIRGPVLAVEGNRASGRLEIGTLWLPWDGDTRWSSGGSRRASAMSREDVARIAVAGVDAEVSRDGFLVETLLYDLARDPGETDPIEDPDRVGRMAVDLDAFGGQLALRRFWSQEDRAVLAPKAIEELRKIGYVR